MVWDDPCERVILSSKRLQPIGREPLLQKQRKPHSGDLSTLSSRRFLSLSPSQQKLWLNPFLRCTWLVVTHGWYGGVYCRVPCALCSLSYSPCRPHRSPQQHLTQGYCHSQLSEGPTRSQTIHGRKDNTSNKITNLTTRYSSHSSWTRFQHGIVNKSMLDTQCMRSMACPGLLASFLGMDVLSVFCRVHPQL